MFRRISFLVLTIISITLIKININLHTEKYSNSEKYEDIILQLNFLEEELKDNHLGVRMQRIFPEGFVFINALYGLSWCELALADSQNNQHFRDRAITEALYAYTEINSNRAKWNFDEFLNPSRGIFYVGWKNYLLSKILSIDSSFHEYDSIRKDFEVNCNLIASAIDSSKSPYLQSYDKHAWPADMFVAMASLSIHDEILEPKYNTLLKKWLKEIKVRLDKETLMIPHKVDSQSGNTTQGSRGCSMGLILKMLTDIDSSFAFAQYEKFKKSFVSKTFGLPSIREYPKGQFGLGDVDSGPVIFGVGFSATIVMIGPLAIYENNDLANRQYKTIHSFGLARKSKDKKKYLLGKLPMADAFIAWGRATELHCQQPSLSIQTKNWRIKFHLITISILLLFWSIYYKKKTSALIKKFIKNHYSVKSK